MPKQRPRILLADASELDSLEFVELLQLYNYEVQHVVSAAQAMELLQKLEFDAVVISLDFPNGGFELSQTILATEAIRDLPLAFVTDGAVDEAMLMEVQFYGGLFLHHKPFNHCELLAQVSSMVRINLLQDELKERMAELDRLASTDALTGLYNRRLFFMRLEEELARAKRRTLPMCLLYIDIDYFKKVNDTYGHAAGDAILQHLSQIMARVLRISDVLGRIGGEEFAILLPETNGQAGQLISERLRLKVEESPCKVDGIVISITISIGVLSIPSINGLDSDSLIRMADKALYDAKAAGRNRVVFYTTELGAESAE